ncbi:hypothetical protein [Sphingobacterium sp. MYb382]|uniref:hypothetical protein n=1 Tax=Sphingobacterium sp. MYb382 TaxID=2745278 RepID=UPI0030ABCC18
MKALCMLIGLLFMQLEIAWSRPIVDSGNSGSTQKSRFIKNTIDAYILEFSNNDTVLNDIQYIIQKAFNDDIVNKNVKALTSLETSLEQDGGKDVNLNNYWIAYINCLKTIVAQQQKDSATAKASDEKGIKLLERNETKGAEDYALLALLRGLSFPFASAGEEMNIYYEIEHLLTNGLGLDKKNVRLQYVQAVLDFYTPSEYGGGYKAEKLLINAIEWPETNIDNPQLPTWGKEEAYDFLVQYYLRENKKESAKKYFKEGIFNFPNSTIILRHKASF